MFPRVGGAMLALAAAALLAVSTLSSAWWSGHPDVDGATRRLQNLDVGPLGATGCNTGGDGKCTSTSVTPAFKITGLVAAGATGLLALTLVILAVSTLRRSEGRRPIGKGVMAGVALVAATGVAILILGPGIKAPGHSIHVPPGYGLALFWSGAATSIAAALVTARDIPRALFIPQPPMPNAMPFDVVAMQAEEQLQRQQQQQQQWQPPPQPIPEPPPPQMMMANRPAQSPGGALPGPSGPLGALNRSADQSGRLPAQAPLFAASPKLRPLYEVEGRPFVPTQPILPERAPTPIPREQIDRMKDGPAPLLAPRKDGGWQTQRPRTNSQLPAPRVKPPTIAPPGPLSRPTPIPRAPARQLDAIPSPPPRPGSRTVPPHPATLATSTLPPLPTVPPMASFVLPMTEPRAGTDASDDEMFETKLRERQEAEDAPLDRGETSSVVDPNDWSVNTSASEPSSGEGDSEDVATSSAGDDHTSPNVNIAMSTSEESAVATDEMGSPRPQTGDVAGDPTYDDTQETQNREKLSLRELGINTVAETALPAVDPQPAPVVAAPPPAVVPPVRSSETKIPISTASQSLPPPTGKQAQTSGPSPACPQCESPMAWVEEHLRFYCKSCRMYF